MCVCYICQPKLPRKILVSEKQNKICIPILSCFSRLLQISQQCPLFQNRHRAKEVRVCVRAVRDTGTDSFPTLKIDQADTDWVEFGHGLTLCGLLINRRCFVLNNTFVIQLNNNFVC